MIVRIAERRRYTTIDNTPIEDERLSFKALGVLTYLLSRPDHWEANPQHLASTHREKEYAIRQALKELAEAGYVIREKYREASTGHFKWVQMIYESPTTTRSAHDAVSASGDAVIHNAVTHNAKIAPVVTTEVGTTEVAKRPSAAAAAGPDPKATDDPVKAHAHKLAVLAMEQPVKPVLRDDGNPFAAVMRLMERLLRAGTSVQKLERAIGAGIEVWTLAGIQTAVAHSSPRAGRRDSGIEAVANRLAGKAAS